MVVRDCIDGVPFSASLADQALTVSLRERLVAACDRAGRLYSYWKDGQTWRRGLSGRMLHKWHDETGRHCAWPDEAGADAITDEAASIFRRLHDLVKARACRWTPDPDALQRVVMLAALDELIAKAQALDDASNRAYQTEIANLQKQRQAAIGGGEIALIDAQIAAKEQERLQRVGAAVKAVTEEWRRQPK